MRTYITSIFILVLISTNCLFAQRRDVENYICLSDDEVAHLMATYKDSIEKTCTSHNDQACEIFLKACNLMQAHPELIDVYIPFFSDEEFIGQFLESVSKHNNHEFKKIINIYSKVVYNVAQQISLWKLLELQKQGVKIGICIESSFRLWDKLASICYERSLYENALYLYNQAHELVIAQHLVADIRQKIGDCHYRMDNILDAIRYYVGAADAFIESLGVESDTTKGIMLKIYDVFNNYVSNNHYKIQSISTLIDKSQKFKYDECAEIIDIVLSFFCYVSIENGIKPIDELHKSYIANLKAKAEKENRSFEPHLHQTVNPIARCYYEKMMLNLANNNLVIFENALDGFYGNLINRYGLKCTDKTLVDFTLDITYALEQYGYYDTAKDLLLAHLVDIRYGCESNEVLITRYIDVLMEQNDYYSAIEQLTKAMAIHEDLRGFKHYRTFWDINNLIKHLLHIASIYHILGEPRRDDYLTIIQQLIEKQCVGKNKKSVLPEAIAGYYFAMGNYAESIEQKIFFYEKHKEFQSEDKFHTYQNLPLANLYTESGEYVKADSLLDEMIDSISFLLLSDYERHLVYTAKVENGIYMLNEELVNEYSHKLFDNVVNDYKRAAKSMISSELANYWNFNYYDFLTTITTSEGTFGDTAELSYDAALFQKGVLQRNMKLRKENILNSSDTTLIKSYERFCNEQRHNTDSVATAELEMMYYYSLHPEFMKGEVVPNWLDVKELLDKNEVAIEFSIMHDIRDNEFYYVALLLDQYSSSPKLVRICKKEDLKSILAKTKLNNGYSTVYDQYDLNGESILYSMIWEPLEKHIKKASTIYFSPIDLLNFVNIENLHKYEGKKSMSELYDMRRVSTTGNINKDSSNDLKSAILFGAIDYNSSITDNNTYEELSHTNTVESQMRGHMSRWSYLPNTSIEVSSINKKLSSVDIQTLTYSGIEATEESFKILSGSNTDILHIATHGFYFSNDKAKGIEYLANKQEDRHGSSSGIRSGILFSGANNAWLGNNTSDSGEDGILNSDEILGMDLSDTELLVLSACQTGLGDVYNDGIYGIQRSFKIAGVNSIIMSLWEVDDEATQIMMTSFYDYLTKGKSIRERVSIYQ